MPEQPKQISFGALSLKACEHLQALAELKVPNELQAKLTHHVAALRKINSALGNRNVEEGAAKGASWRRMRDHSVQLLQFIQVLLNTCRNANVPSAVVQESRIREYLEAFERSADPLEEFCKIEWYE